MSEEKKQFSALGDLTNLGRDLEKVFKIHFDNKRVAFVFGFTIEPDFDEVHFAMNVSRENGIKIFEDTAKILKRGV